MVDGEGAQEEELQNSQKLLQDIYKCISNLLQKKSGLYGSQGSDIESILKIYTAKNLKPSKCDIYAAM